MDYSCLSKSGSSNRWGRKLVLWLTLALLVFSSPIESQMPLRPTVYIDWNTVRDLLAVGYENHLEIIDPNSGEVLAEQENDTIYFSQPSWSQDGTRLIFSTGVAINVWNTPWEENNTITSFYQQERSRTTVGYMPILEPLWSPNASLIMAQRSGERIEIWDADSGQFAYSLQVWPITATLWLSNEQLITGSMFGSAAIWDISTNETVSALSVNSSGYNDPDINSLALSPDRRWIAVGASDNSVRLWDLSLTGNISSEDAPWNPDILRDPRLSRTSWFPIITLDWSPDGRYIAGASQNGVVYIWDFTTRTLIGDLLVGGGRTQVFSVQWSPYGGRLAYSSVPDKSSERWLNSPLARSIAGGNVEVIVPFPTFERLHTIAEGCLAPEIGGASVSDKTRLPEFVTTIEALSDEQIPPGCKADLVAVAEAIQATE
jgi:WD40 repeat protein